MSLFRNLPYEWQVGLRYTRAGRRSGRNSFISFISLISMAGIALGVAALIVVLSVMNGFQKEVRDRMLSVLAHIEVIGANGALPDWHKVAAEALQNKAVLTAAPYVDTQTVVSPVDGGFRGAIVRGVLPSEELNVSEVATTVKIGNLTNLKPGEFGIVLGIDLARALDVNMGGKVKIFAPQGQVTPAGVIPRWKAFTVVGIFDAGHYEFDSTLAYVHLEDAERLFQLEGPTGVRLKVADMQKAPQVAQELARSMTSDVLLRDWSKQNKNWFAAVQTEKTMMFLILALIIAVAAFNLVSTLVMTVTDKQADIAILRTLGAAPRSIMQIFMVQGSIVGLLGTFIGVTLGVITAWNVDKIVSFIERLLGVQFLPRDVYLLSGMPSDMRWPDVGSIALVAIVLAFLATLYPSWSASRVKPAEALRYE